MTASLFYLNIFAEAGLSYPPGIIPEPAGEKGKTQFSGMRGDVPPRHHFQAFRTSFMIRKGC